MPISFDVDQREYGTPARDVSENGLSQERRRVIADLQAAIQNFFKTPPSIPMSISGRKLEDWEPVFEPIVASFRPFISSIVETAAKLSDSSLERMMRELRSEFRLRQARSGLTWIVEAPRLITRLIGDQLLLDAYLTERWPRLVQIGQPAFESYIGRVPWVLSPEYRHPETLGRDANVALGLSLREIQRGGAFGRVGVSDSRIASTYAAVSVGLALGTMAREEASSPGVSHSTWAMLPGVWDEFEAWEEDPGITEAWAALAGEPVEVFRSAIQRRISRMISGYQSMGYFLDPSRTGWGSIARISEGAGEITRGSS